MEAYRAIVGKRDTRRYLERPIDEETAQRILQAGRMAGSAQALQPVSFIVVRERAQQEAVAACGRACGHLVGAPLVVVLVLVPELGVVGAPFSLFRGPFDAGRAAQNMMLAAWELGIGSCPASLHDAEAASRVLGLPEGHLAVNTIAFGYPAGPDAVAGQRPRKPIEEFIHYERW